MDSTTAQEQRGRQERLKPDIVVPRQLSGDGQKYFVDIVGVLGRRLHEEKPVLLRVAVGLLVLDGAPVGQVRLVAGERDHDVRSEEKNR